MPKTTPTNCPRAYIQSPQPVSCGRRSTWRLARSAVIVLGAGTLAGLAVFLFTSTRGKEAFAVPETCTPPLPEPGPARPWEAQVSVSTYSSVNTRNGNVFTAIPVVSWSGRGPDMNMMLYHNSAAVGDPSFAQAVGFNLAAGWSISYSDHLRFDVYPNPTRVTVVADDGTTDVFTWNGTIWVPPGGVHDQLAQVADDPNLWRLLHKDQSFHEFTTSYGDGIGHLKRIVDAADNFTNLIYGPIGSPPVPRLGLVGAAGRALLFEYDPSGRLYRIKDPRDANEPPGADIQDRYWTFDYDPGSGRLSKLTGPRGKPIDVAYDLEGRIHTISDRHDAGTTGSTWTYTYTDGRLTQVDDPGSVIEGGDLWQQFAFVCSGSPSQRSTITTYTNRRGFPWVYRYPEAAPLAIPANAGTLKSVQDPVGTTQYGFDGGGNLVWYSDANYHVWEATYDWAGNVLTLRDPLFHTQSWTYDFVNNVTSHTDAAGNMVRYYYDHASDTPTPYPTLLTRIVEPNDGGNPPPNQPAGQEWPYPVTRMKYYLTGGCDPLLTGPPEDDDYGCHGQLQEVTDPNGVWTGFTYDQWGQSNRYREGKYTATVAAGDTYVYVMNTAQDSGGNTTASSSSGGGGGSSGHDSDGNLTSSTCMSHAALQAPGAGPNWFPFALPCYPPALPERSAEFFSATYGPRNELLDLPLDLDDGTTRTHTRTYDVMGRPLSVSVESNEAHGAQITRTFTHSYDVPAGSYTRTGPDNVETFVQLDGANRVQYLRRGASSSPLMTANYTYFDNNLVQSVTYGNGASVHYSYDPANRVTRIEHRNAVGLAMLRMDYTYYANDLPQTITESGSTVTTTTATTFTYDQRSRLTAEQRTGQSPYYRVYEYDAGGNRTKKKIDPPWGQEVWYHYDLEDPALYGSKNNRLMYEELMYSGTLQLVSTTYYEYSGDGNVTRVITEQWPPPAEEQFMAAGAPSLDASGTPVSPVAARAPSLPGVGDGGGAEGLLLDGAAAMAAAPPTGPQYSAVRLGYAGNGRTVTFAHGETWTGSSGCPNDYQISWAREFRYDGARARYMNRKLDPADLLRIPPVYTALSTTWSDYDGDDIYGDFEMVNGSPVNKRSFEPGIARTENPLTAPVTNYYHGDMLGTTRMMSNSSGSSIEPVVYTAFGERMTGPATTDATRYGYVGAWGYQTHADFPYLHVGARYYDPSSGRFLQRDPIGIRGGLNVYGYLRNVPGAKVDPSGLRPHDWEPPMPKPPPPKPEPPQSPADIQEELDRVNRLNWWLKVALSCALGYLGGGGGAASLWGAGAMGVGGAVLQ